VSPNITRTLKQYTWQSQSKPNRFAFSCFPEKSPAKLVLS